MRTPRVTTDNVLARLRQICLAFPETSEAPSWGHPNFRAGKKVFAAYEQIGGRPSIAFRLDPTDVDLLLRRKRFFPTPYGRGQWVSLHADGRLSWRLIEHFLDRSYRVVALKRMIAALDAGSREKIELDILLNPIAIHAFNPGPITGAGNWTWLIPGRVPTLVDAGTGDPRHLDALVHALDGAALEQVLVTHSHSDHAAGAPAIGGRMPHARFLKMPWPERDSMWTVPWAAIADGDAIAVGDTEVTAIHTPGHAPDHLCFWHPGSRTLFGGDLAVQGTTVWIPTSLSGDLSDYMASLERILALAPARILPAHGAVIEDPQQLLRDYVAHRREREQQVLEALGAGDSDPDAIVERIYRSVKERLLPLAREGVIAQLIKLEREGRARRDGEAWHIIDE